MPAKSRKQFRFLEALLHDGLKKKPKGLSKKTAAEFINKTPSYSALPEKASKKK